MPHLGYEAGVWMNGPLEGWHIIGEAFKTSGFWAVLMGIEVGLDKVGVGDHVCVGNEDPVSFGF